MSNATVPSLLPLPPGPRELPVLGSITKIARDTHRAINEIAQQWGDVCMIRVGNIPTVIISNPKILHDAFSRPEFNDRWVSRTFEIMTERESVSMPPMGQSGKT